MKIVSLVLAAAMAAVIGSSPLRAQSSSDQGNAPRLGSQMAAPTHPGPNQWARDRDWYARPGWQPGGPSYGWMGPGMMAPNAGWMMGGGPAWRGRYAGWRRRHQRARGARFTFTRGNARVDIQCPANQSLKDCVDAASTLIDKVRSLKTTVPPPQSGPKPPAGAEGSRPMPGPMPGDVRPNMRTNRP